ncbi:MAG: sigma-54-dependent Fis family transcriptional regulator [Clostridiaceae bacterium]|nr:sigma-54-dependent Fis family transcriptional regulator [Clostridiaceae bacterium]
MKYSILIVDSDETIHKFLRSCFIQDGFIVLSVSSGEEALMMISSHQIDLVISELQLTGMNGIELLKKVKKLSPSIEFVLITEHITTPSAIEALRNGASDYLSKLTELEDVSNSIRSILSNKEKKIKYKSFNEDTDSIIENYLISKSSSMMKIMDLVKQVAASKATIMLYGETGTGKSVMAEILHKLSTRIKKPLIKVNCAAIPEQLLESELFGYEKGAFTGAVATKPGRFELANGGTLFLDEIGDISPFMQVKLLRVLQEKEFEHLGGIKTIKVDVRVITATNKNLVAMVKNGTFREDLYYRLNVVPINLPSLRERKEDIKALVNHFLLQNSKQSGDEICNISKEALDKLIKYSWPGNIRELENVIERCVVVTPGNLITLDNLPQNILNFKLKLSNDIHLNTLTNSKESIEKEEIIKTLSGSDNNITRAAEILGVSRRTLHRKLIKYKIQN